MLSSVKLTYHIKTVVELAPYHITTLTLLLKLKIQTHNKHHIQVKAFDLLEIYQ